VNVEAALSMMVAAHRCSAMLLDDKSSQNIRHTTRSDTLADFTQPLNWQPALEEMGGDREQLPPELCAHVRHCHHVNLMAMACCS
jgi:hypothetical protein